MPDVVLEALTMLARALEITGAGALALGFIIATLRCALRWLRHGRGPAVQGYRQSLGRVVLVGLEILVAATIIKTITLDPTAASMGMLAGMVAIRTMLGWAMVLEMSGRWPWQSARSNPANASTK